MIKLNTKGKILSGDEEGYYVLVKSQREHSGEGNGYYIFTSSSLSFDSPETYDNWVKDFAQLESYFKSSNWKIEWIE